MSSSGILLAGVFILKKKKKSKLYMYLLKNLVAAEDGAAKALDVSISFWFY